MSKTAALKISIPETTSAEAFERHGGGKCLAACRGEAWRDAKVWIIAPPCSVEMVPLPAVSEPFLAGNIYGAAEFRSAKASSRGSRMHPERFFFSNI